MATLQNDTRTILIDLTTNAKAAQFACNRLFEAPTAASLGGAAAFCSVTGKQLATTLGASATILPGGNLTIIAGGAPVLQNAITGANFVGTASLASCGAGCVAPIAAVTAPAVSCH